MTNSRSAALRVAVGFWFSAIVVHAADLQLFEAVQAHMGTLVRIQLYAPDAGRAKAGFDAAFERIAQVDAALSDYRADSEVNRVCASAVGKPVHVGPDLFGVLAASLRVGEETGGAFDVTLGPVTQVWRQARRDHRLPEPAAVREALAHTGYGKLHLDAAERAVTLDQAGMRLDFGGIGKGYAAEAALTALADLGIRRALVAASGDLAIGDSPPGRRGWTVGIDGPGENAEGFTRRLELCNAAVSTSGAREQNLEAGGVKYSHIVDPRTGMGLMQAGTVAVVARHGIDADAWSTALSVLGAARGMPLIEGHAGMEALFTSSTGVVESPGWRALGCR